MVAAAVRKTKERNVFLTKGPLVQVPSPVTIFTFFLCVHARVFMCKCVIRGHILNIMCIGMYYTSAATFSQSLSAVEPLRRILAFFDVIITQRVKFLTL